MHLVKGPHGLLAFFPALPRLQHDARQQLARLYLRVIAVLQHLDPIDHGAGKPLPHQFIELLLQSIQRCLP